MFRKFAGAASSSAAVREVMAPTGHLDQLPKRGHRGRAGIPPASDGIGEAGRVEVDISRSREVDVVTDVELGKSVPLERRLRDLEAEDARLAAGSDVAGAGTAAACRSAERMGACAAVRRVHRARCRSPALVHRRGMVTRPTR